MFADAGKDVVCAAVSVLVINTINGIEQFTEDAILLDSKNSSAKKSLRRKKSDDENFIHFYLTEDISEQAQLLMKVLVLGLTEINKQYGDSYLTLNFREV